jgi:hypothetical protein
LTQSEDHNRMYDFENVSCDQFWRGDTLQERSLRTSKRLLRLKQPGVALIISLCKTNLTWLHKELASLLIKSITIYSKCGREDLGRRFLQEYDETVPDTRMLTLSNVGRVDHNIAHYLNALSNAKKPSDRILLFVKDTNDQKVHQPYQEKVLLAQMVSKAATSTLGFACGLVPVFQGYTNNRTMSIWHDTSRLMTFSLPRYGNGRYNKSTHDVKFNSAKSFSEWAESMQIRFPTPLAPVCYGGSFAVKQSNIARSQRSFKHLELSFSRGDNIVEGHYGERSWAAILMPRISQNVTQILQHMAFEVLNSYYVGALLGCNSSHR